ncbi:N-acetyltransferase [Stutzerimonas kirkiae]|uniref:N-acetyltransferase n=1 Tax=Stutzerimonas kirkiae TaxID=2211392 RepID=A0A4Q9R0Y7_9GAMM|nr:GNAT family N-acetyltransferase [Stutzerimonas kirkiae]TBU91297.1 N-acetyltransferase [Stutzerimonas kirkiae]TBV00433.1 N-acetyltransferase [Stutzerimonas kirkiae]TBV15275.1 N-acetyltransferase [Stutzerimonas kirkiae]
MSDTPVIHHDASSHQFETTVQGQRAYLAYMDLGKRTLDIYRTFVPDALRGRGIAASLAKHALDYAEREGYEVIASCSYVERYMDDLWRQEQKARGED